ncbi:MAG: YncE family protein [Candidatus Nanopelagicales bacterium]
MRRSTWTVCVAAGVLGLAGCATASGSSPASPSVARAASTPEASGTEAAAPVPSSVPQLDLLPGMPPPLDPRDVYAADRPGDLSATVAHDPARVYVPNSGSDTVTVIDPRTYRVLGTFRVGRQPQHVVPSHDLRTLWVNNDLGNSLTPIDPRTGRPGRAVPVADPYNLYFTPDGRYAVVMASKLHRLDFRDARTMALHRSVPVPCGGVNHADWTADGRFFLVSCEFTGQLLWVDTARERVLRVIDLPHGSMPQDVKLSPDGTRFYVADMMSNGVWIYRVTPQGPVLDKLLPTGLGAHGLYVSRDSTRLYVSNRGEGSISVVRFSDDRVVALWQIPGRASPDMGNLSADGRVLWLSGRYDSVVYAIDTTTGHLLARIRVGLQPHGLTVWPQPGRYSLGHTGIMR